MDMGIVSAVQVKVDVYEKLDKELLGYVEDVLLNRREDSTVRDPQPSLTASLSPKPKIVCLRTSDAYS